jgi:hypothetical protein
MGLPELTADISSLAGSSPKNIAAIAVLRLYEKYWEAMALDNNFNVERGTAALIICCPEANKREAIWAKFISERDKTGSLTTASVLAVGEWYTYMSSAMGLHEKSYGGA